jgi:hypothetical protein
MLKMQKSLTQYAEQYQANSESFEEFQRANLFEQILQILPNNSSEKSF